MAVVKILSELIYPLNQSILLMAIGLWLIRKRRQRAAFLVISLALLAVAIPSIPVFSDPVVGWLERRYPSHPIDEYPQCDAIVVLGGSVKPIFSPRHDAEEVGEARLLQVVRLYKAKRAPRIVTSGGPPAEGASVYGHSEGDDMKEILVASGVPHSAIFVEAGSTNTFENAKESAALLKNLGCKSILLVSTAMHMRRAVPLFRKQGLDVVAVPSSFRVVETPRVLQSWMPHAITLWQSSLAIKEIVGYFGYQCLGRL